METIKDIQAKIDKRKRYGQISIFFVVTYVVLLILFKYYHLSNEYERYFIAYCCASFVLLAKMNPSPEYELSTYDKVRYSAHYLNVSLKSRDTEKAISYLNELALNIESLNHKMKNFPFQKSNIGTLEKLLMVLKYKFYPDILKNNNTAYYADTFEHIQKAIEAGNMRRLSSLALGSLEGALENKEDVILLPYEMPSLLNRAYNEFLSTTIKTFYENFIFRLMILIMVLSTIGYLFSEAISFLKFDTTFFSAILVLAFGLTKEISKK